jgi:hypothetical protein
VATEIETFSSIKTAYQALIVEYVSVLRAVATGRPDILTREVIEDHIRVKLCDIAKAFTLCQTYLTPYISAEDATWLGDQIDYLTKLAEQLATIAIICLEGANFALWCCYP